MEMDANPYRSPMTSSNLPKRTYTRFRLLVDVFALIFAILPVSINVLEYYVDKGVFIDSAPLWQLWVFLICLLLMLLLWLVSLVINTAGAFRLRPVSIFGLLLNIVSLIAAFLP